MQDTVVIGGDCSLTVPVSGDCVLDIISDGQLGMFTTIREIPSNYGLIEWDGSVLTVS